MRPDVLYALKSIFIFDFLKCKTENSEENACISLPFEALSNYFLFCYQHHRVSNHGFQHLNNFDQFWSTYGQEFLAV